MYKPIYVLDDKHEKLKKFARKKGKRLNDISDKVISAGMKILKIR